MAKELARKPWRSRRKVGREKQVGGAHTHTHTHTRTHTLTHALTGLSKDELILELRQWKRMETDPHEGKIFAYVYTRAGGKFDAVETAFNMFQFGDKPSEGEKEGEKEGGSGKESETERKMDDSTKGVASFQLSELK